MDVREQLQALDGAHGEIERVGDRLLVPAAFLQVLDAAPDVDAGHGRADQVFRQRHHRNVRVVIVVLNEHVDRRKLRGDRGLYATATSLDDEFAVRLAHHRRLNDADRFDRGDELLVHCGRHRRAARIVRVRLERTRIDAPEFGHGVLLCGSVLPPVCFGRPLPPAAVAADRGKGEAGEAGPRARARVDPCGGGRHCGSVVPISEQACLFALLSGAAGFRRVARMQNRRARL